MYKNLSRRKFLGATGMGVAGSAVLAKASQKITSPVHENLRETAVTTESFAREVERVLPADKPFGYQQRIRESAMHQLMKDPAAKPLEAEFALNRDVKLCYVEDNSELIKDAVKDFQDYLKTAMEVDSQVDLRKSWKGIKSGDQVVLIGTRHQLPEYGKELKCTKSYALVKTPKGLIVCGYDDYGVLHGLYNLQARMNLREGPFLPRSLKIIRQSLYQRRMALSGMGWMEWPDQILSAMAHNGFDGIFASVYANPNGDRTTAETSTDFYARLLHKVRKQDPAKIHDLIARAGKFGIKVYTPIIYQYTGTPESEAGLRKLVRDIIKEFPLIKGYVLLTEGFWYKKWGGLHGADEAHVQDWARNWSKAIAMVTEECHRVNPETEILAWEYNIDFRPQNTKLKKYFIQQLPADAIPMLTWENGKGFELDGMQGYLRDYSLSQVGPAEVTQAQIGEANGRSMKVYSKVDTFASWQFGTIPYLPFPGQWRKRYDALQAYGVSGTLESWSSGYTPNFIAELRYWTCWDNSMSFQELLGAMASRLFGAAQQEKVLQAWEHFDKAIRLVPDTGPNMGTNNAIGNPLFFQEPPVRTATFHNSWTDHDAWMGYLGGELNPYWPFTVSRMVFYPDFSNKTNRAEQYARGATGIVAGKEVALLPVFLKHLKMAAAEMEEGLKLYRAAAMESPDWKRKRAVSEVVVAEHLHRMMESNCAVLEFEELRFNRAHEKDNAKAAEMLKKMEKIVTAEIARTKLSLIAATHDSRLGFQFEQDYVYTPYSLKEKLLLLEDTLNKQLPLAAG
jgi:hypothetical protein